MSQIKPAAPFPPYVENLFAPEILATEVSFISGAFGMVTLTFSSLRVDNSEPAAKAKRVPVARLVMPAPGAQQLAVSLYDWLRSRGLDPGAPPAGGKVQ